MPLFELAVGSKEKTGADIKFINLSGGIGVPISLEKKLMILWQLEKGKKGFLKRSLVPAGLGDVAIFTELGRFMLAPYGHLVSTATHENIYKEYIGLDSCAVDLIRPAMYNTYHHITVLGKEDLPHDHKYDITGSL